MRSPSTSKAPPSKVGLKRGPWTPEEDELLANYINKEGEGRWRTLPKRAGLLRCGKSCRLRWMNYLRPCVKRGQIAPDEEDLILRLHRLLGNRWSLIAGRIPGRTDNEIKNYWNTHLSKKLISQGIDPRTHKPLDPDSVDQLIKPPSSSKPNRKLPSFNSHNPISSKTSGTTPTTVGANKENNGHIENTPQMEQYHAGNNASSNGYAGLLNCNHGLGRNEVDNEDINYCTDDVFSSFLNSLINEEAFTIQQQQLQPSLQPNGSSCDDPLVGSTFGLGTGWESAITASTFTQEDPKMVREQVE